MEATSAIVSHGSCGGTTRIPFRYIQVDADETAVTGVPEAHTPLKTMLNRFATARLSHEDMATLVACGNTLVGVHIINFPEISKGDMNPYNDTRDDI
jgi:hypothetical protein